MKQTSNIDPSVEEGQGLNGSISSSSDGTSTGDHDVDAGIMKGDDELQDQSETKNGTYPADCYSFLAIHGPIKSPAFFTFGLTVWLFQVREDPFHSLFAHTSNNFCVSSCIVCRSNTH